VSAAPNRRILIVDDNAAIHADFRKILSGTPGAPQAASEAEAALFGDDPPAGRSGAAPAPADDVVYAIDSAMQGEEAFERVQSARREELPYAMAFVDVRMPPGWDGVETSRRLWEVEPDLQIVICTAYSDYTWPETVAQLGRTDRLVILKKPFDPVEVCQLAAALTEKWNSVMRERQNLRAATRAEAEARAYASSLETLNRALESSWARSEGELVRKRDFLLRLATEVLAPAQALLARQIDLAGLERGDARALLALERVGDPATALVGALGSVLELAAIDAGTARAERVACSPWELCRQLSEDARAAAAARGVAIEVARAGDVPESLQTDPARLRAVVGELLANAVRHTQRGAVRVQLAVQDGSDGVPAALRITVADTGAGLSRHSLAHLFDPFPPPEDGRGAAGPGLGLALCKRTVALLGGEIRGENAPDGGACFAILLPLER
jgi:signal transduction histidine kinase